MNSISVNQFRDNLKIYVEQSINEHQPIKITRRAGEDFKALCKILKEILHSDPANGLGKPETLKHNLSGLWSKRFSQKDRLIYRFDDNCIYIFAIGGHYDQHYK